MSDVFAHGHEQGCFICGAVSYPQWPMYMNRSLGYLRDKAKVTKRTAEVFLCFPCHDQWWRAPGAKPRALADIPEDVGLPDPNNPGPAIRDHALRFSEWTCSFIGVTP
jgi:hypothetical protein